MVDVKYDYCCRNIRGVVGVGRAGWDAVRCGGGGGGGDAVLHRKKPFSFSILMVNVIFNTILQNILSVLEAIHQKIIIVSKCV